MPNLAFRRLGLLSKLATGACFTSVIAFWGEPAAAQEGSYPAARATESPRRSTGLMVTGIVLTSLGSVSSGIGGSMWIAAIACGGPDPHVSESEDGCGGSRKILLALGAVWLTGGTAGIGAGIPLWVLGAERPRERWAASSTRPDVTVGPGSVRLRWTF